MKRQNCWQGLILVVAALMLLPILAGKALADAAGGTFTVTGNMAIERKDHNSILLRSGKVLIVGGQAYPLYPPYNLLKTTELYDPTTGAFSVGGSMSEGHCAGGVVLLPNGKVLVISGLKETDTWTKTVELYDPTTNTWTTVAPLTTARVKPTTILLPNGKVLVAGGQTSNGVNFTASAELYDPATDSWSATSPMSMARLCDYPGVLLTNGKVLVAGGYVGSSLVTAAAELFDPTTNTWSPAGSMAAARDSTLTLLPNGKVLAVGGSSSSGVLSSAELYDPASNSWSAAASLPAARLRHAIWLLQDGNVLLSGGDRGNGWNDVYSDALIYNVSANTWTSAGQSMTASRSCYASVVLQDGRVLMTGGIANGNNYLQTAELYDPRHLMGGAIQGKPINVEPAVVSTIAGTAGVVGSTDGTGAAAGFSFPHGFTTDGSNLYVSDHANHTIRKVVIATGEVTTIAGSTGQAGTADGIGSAARFRNPLGITTDGTNLYVTDHNSHTIRKVVIATGEVTTVAGSAGSTGATDGIGLAARFYNPAWITMVGNNLYVTENQNTIRKVVIATGEVTTLAGSAWSAGATDGTGTAARFSAPQGIITDGTNLYVTERNNHTIRKIIIATGEVLTLTTNLYDPRGITTDGTNLYVADGENRIIRKVVIATGVATTIAGAALTGGATDGMGTVARFDHPIDVTTDGTNLYVLDAYKNTIRKITAGDLTTGLVASYPFNGNANDASGNGNNGTVNGATLTADRFGNTNSAYSFDGVNDFVLVGDPVPMSIQIQNEITLSAWIYATHYPTEYSNVALIVGSQYDSTSSGISIFLDSRPVLGHITLNIGNGTGLWHETETTTQVPLNQWVHIVATRKANEDGKIYFNGILQPSTNEPWDGTISYSGAQFAIGQQKDMNRPFHGPIDDIRIYNRALSSAEIQTLYNEIPQATATVPGIPTINTVTPGNGQATVTFTAPASNGGSPITGYTVTSIPAGGVDSNAGSTATTHVITGLHNGTAYTFTVTASNAVGTSTASTPSTAVTAVAPAIITLHLNSDGSKYASGPAFTGGSRPAGNMPQLHVVNENNTAPQQDYTVLLVTPEGLSWQVKVPAGISDIDLGVVPAGGVVSVPYQAVAANGSYTILASYNNDNPLNDTEFVVWRVTDGTAVSGLPITINITNSNAIPVNGFLFVVARNNAGQLIADFIEYGNATTFTAQTILPANITAAGGWRVTVELENDANDNGNLGGEGDLRTVRFEIDQAGLSAKGNVLDLSFQAFPLNGAIRFEDQAGVLVDAPADTLLHIHSAGDAQDADVAVQANGSFSRTVYTLLEAGQTSPWSSGRYDVTGMVRDADHDKSWGNGEHSYDFPSLQGITGLGTLAAPLVTYVKTPVSFTVNGIIAPDHWVSNATGQVLTASNNAVSGFGYRLKTNPSTITDEIVHDRNGNGIFDANDGPLSVNMLNSSVTIPANLRFLTIRLQDFAWDHHEFVGYDGWYDQGIWGTYDGSTGSAVAQLRNGSAGVAPDPTHLTFFNDLNGNYSFNTGEPSVALTPMPAVTDRYYLDYPTVITAAMMSTTTPPTASFTSTVTGNGPKVAFDASASVDTNGRIVSYAWNFGDTNTGSGVQATHYYAALGDYTVTLTVTDNDSLTNSSQKTVTITNRMPVAADLPSQISVSPGKLIDLNLSQYVTDADLDTLSYSASGLASLPGASFDPANGHFTWQPSAIGAYSLPVSVNDSHGGQISIAIQIVVENLTSSGQTGGVIQPQVPTGEGFSYSGSSLPTGWSVNNSNGAITIPAETPPGVYTITIMVSDGSRVQVTITVTPPALLKNPDNGHSYQLITTPMTWTAAKANCESKGGYLATITSQAENDFVFNNFRGAPHAFWLGGTDAAVEGTWQWVTGEPWSYTISAWGEGYEPNGLGNENSLLFYVDAEAPNSGAWVDGPTLFSAPSLCEWDTVDTDSGLVASYPFNGNANDASGNGNNGTVNGATLTADRNGFENQAYTFDGENSFIDIMSLQSQAVLSISFWVNNAGNIDGTIVSGDNGSFDRSIRIGSAGATGCSSDNSIFVHTGISGACTGSTASLNVWTHIVLEYTFDDIKLFFNGINVWNNGAPASNWNEGNWRIGADSYLGVSKFFNGKIDDVRIYSRALSSAEVQTLYSQAQEPTATIATTVPTTSTFGELVELSGTAGPGAQTISAHEWSIVKLVSGAETGAPLTIGTTATLVTNTLPIGAYRLRYRVKNSFEVWSTPACKDITITDPVLFSDLSVHRDGIRFLDPNGQTVLNPKQGEQVTILAEVKNLSLVDSPASVLLTVKDDVITIGSTTIATLSKGTTATVSIPWHVGYDSTDQPIANYVDGYKVISVAAAYSTTTPEISKDNNLATCFVVIGSQQNGAYGINITVASSSTSHYTGYTTTIYGEATYSWGSLMPTMGSQVSIVINGVTYTTRTTSPMGGYAQTVTLPATAGSYAVTVQVSDNNLSGSTSLELAVSTPPAPSPADLLVQALNFSGPGLYSSGGNTYSQTGSALNFSAVVRNNGGLATTAGFTVNFYANDVNTPLCQEAVSTLLGPQQSITVNCATPFTSSSAGVVTVLAKIDPDNTVAESNEFNNQGSRGLEIRNAMPDLRPSAINFSASPTVGDTITLSAEVSNNGPANLPSNTQIVVEFRDGSASGQLLGSSTVSNPAALTPGAKLTASISWNTTGFTSGNHQIYAVVDPANLVAEDFENNNQMSNSVTLFPTGSALAPSAISFSNYGPTVSIPLTITGTIKNTGSLDAGGDTIRFYLGDPANGGALINSCTTGAVTGKNGTASCAINTTSPASVGTFVYYAKSSNEQVIARALTTYEVPPADLQILSTRIYHTPTTPNFGQTVSLAADIKNVSPSQASGSFAVRFYVDNQGLLTQIGSAVPVTSLAPGETIGVIATSTFAANENSYAIKVKVVPVDSDANMEDNEATSSFSVGDVPGAPVIGTATAGNNQATVTFAAPVTNGGNPVSSYTVTSSPGGLIASGITSPLTVTGLTNGTAYTFTVTATNAIGTGAASEPSNSVTPTPSSYTVSGNAGISGVTLSYTDGTAQNATANDSGHYSFSVSYNWSGTVTPSKAGYTFSPASKAYTNVLTNQAAQNYTATPITYTISGNAGVFGATLSYTDGTVKTATADGTGNYYSFTVSYNWSGTVTPSKTGYTFSPTNKAYTNVLTNQSAQNYTATPITVTISGNAGATGVILGYTDGTAKTTPVDDSGNYSFMVSAGWSGTVTPSKTGYTFSPANRAYTNVLTNQTNQNYTINCQNDADGDGVCDNMDNCPTVANTNQANADGDSYGNACDACPNDATNACGSPWTPMTGTQYNMVVYGTAYDGTSYAIAGDWLGAFGPGGESDCRAIYQIGAQGFYYLTIAGNTNGEKITYKLFRHSDDQQFNTDKSILFQADTTAPDVELRFGCTQSLNFINGWNWISLNVLPQTTDPAGFFGAGSSLVEQVKTQSTSMTNAAGIGWIGDDANILAKAGQGSMFKVKTSGPFTLAFVGTCIPVDTQINLAVGWSWVAYLPGDCLSPETSLGTILSDLYQVKGQSKSKTQIPGVGLAGDLNEMCSGSGYTIKMDQAHTLVYPGN